MQNFSLVGAHLLSKTFVAIGTSLSFGKFLPASANLLLGKFSLLGARLFFFFENFLPVGTQLVSLTKKFWFPVNHLP